MRRPAMMAEMMLLLNRFSWLRHKVAPATARPAVFTKMLAMHVGEISHPQFVMDAILPLGCQMLRT